MKPRSRSLRCGPIWAITHHCHKNGALLDSGVDQRRYQYWLFQARRRFGLCVLNYVVLPNAVKLLVMDRGRGEIPCSVHYAAKGMAEDFQVRLHRPTAFWQDTYQTRVIPSQANLPSVLLAMDMSVVREGLAHHPGHYLSCGFYELQHPPKLGRRLDLSALQRLLNPFDLADLQHQRRQWVSESLQLNPMVLNDASPVSWLHDSIQRDRPFHLMARHGTPAIE